MDTVITSSWLDYGAFGLLVIVLICVGYALNVYVKSNSKHLEQQSAHIEEQSVFVRNLAEKSIDLQEKHMESWKLMTADTLAMFAKFAGEINGLRDDLEDKTKTLHEEHRDIKENMRGLVKEKL